MLNISKTVTDTMMEFNGSRIWNHPWAIDWHHDRWPVLDLDLELAHFKCRER